MFLVILGYYEVLNTFIESANIHYRWTYLDNQSLIRIKQKDIMLF